MLAIGAVTYVALAYLQWSDLDEGVYFLAAVQVAHGQVPFVNFVGIEPVVPYYLAAGVVLFGPSLIVARIQLVGLVLVTAGGLYLVGRRQHSRAAGVIAASVFLFSPLSLFYSSIVILEAASLAPLVFATAILLRRKLDPTLVPSLVIGALLGVAVLTRRDTALLFPLFLGCALYRQRAGEWLRALLGVTGGFLAVVGAVLGYVTWRTSFGWTYAQYGLGAAYAAHSIALPLHFGVLAYGILTLPAAAVGLTGVGAAFLQQVGRPAAARAALSVGGLVMLLILLYGLSYQSWGQGDYFFPDLEIAFLVVLVCWLAVRVAISGAPRTVETRATETVPLLLGWLVLILVFFTAVYPTIYVHYLIELTAPGSLLLGVYVAQQLAPQLAPAAAASGSDDSGVRASRSAFPGWRRQRAIAPPGPMVRAALLAVALIVPSAMAAVLILGPTNPYNNPYENGLPAENLYQRVYPISEIDQVAEYVDARTAPNATIFTADSIFAAEANRLVLLNLSTIIDDYAYRNVPLAMDQSPLATESFGLAPTPSQIFAAWNHTYVPYVIIGNRTMSLLSVTPYLELYLSERYHPVAVFNPGLIPQTVVVEALGPSPSGARLVATVSTEPETSSIAVDPTTGTAYVADFESPTIQIVNTSGNASWLFLPPGFSGITTMLLSPSATELVAAIPEDAIVVYAVSPTGALTYRGEVDTPAPVTSLAFGLNSTALFALVPSLSSVMAINLAPIAVSRMIPTVTSPEALAVDTAREELVVSSAIHADLAAYNLATGALVRHYGLGAMVGTALESEGTFVIGENASQSTVFWLNLTSGSILPEDNVGAPVSGLALGSGIVVAGGRADGIVDFFDEASASPMGVVATGGCTASVAFDPVSHALWTGGPCSQSVQEWSVSPPVPFPIVSPSGTSVFVNGLLDTQPTLTALVPGVYVLEGLSHGGAAVALVSVTGPGTANLTVPLPFELGPLHQALFAAVVAAASVVAAGALIAVAARRPDWFLRGG